MAELKTKPTTASVETFLARIKDPRRKADALAVLELLKSVTRKPPRMWGSSIVGFDSYRYSNASGRGGEWPMIGFSPRATALTLYIMPGFEGRQALLDRLGKHTTGVSCLYIKKLDDVDPKVLREIATEAYAFMKAKYV